MEDQVRAADSGKEKNSARGPSFPILPIHIYRCRFELISVITILIAGHAPANTLAGILLLPIATLLSFYVKQVQHINLHLSLIFL
ncbi:hypothetical protein LHV56_18050 [Peribacillus frigoritolerans]|nr:hypothetical protein [Peribacillus frigoritolerans]USK78752.1 hypothetical protein LHV56_18050 [Peribacillus frigoritolerans]